MSSKNILGKLLRGARPLNQLIAVYQHATYAEEQKAAWLARDEMVKHNISQRCAQFQQRNFAIFLA